MKILNLFSGDTGSDGKYPNATACIVYEIQPLLADTLSMLEKAVAGHHESARLIGNHFTDDPGRIHNRFQFELRVEFWSSDNTWCGLYHLVYLNFDDEAESKDAVLQSLADKMIKWAKGKVELLEKIKAGMEEVE